MKQAISASHLAKWAQARSSDSESESDKKKYIYFEFCEGKNHKGLKNTLMYKVKQFMLKKIIMRKVYIFYKIV